MSLINLSMKHGRTFEDARAQLSKAVDQVSSTFGSFVQRTEWAQDRNSVKLAGTGFEIDMRVDSESVYVTGDVPFLGKLLGSPMVAKLKGIMENTFQKKLPDKPKGT